MLQNEKKLFNFGVNQCISGHVISQNMAFIKFFLSQPFLAHLWGAYAIPVALSGVRRLS